MREVVTMQLLKNINKNYVGFSAIILMLIAAGFTSPLYPYYTGRDSSTFLVMARGILNGKLPYLDLFDHKGPIFYWMESFGYLFGGRIGVFIFQCILMLLDLYWIRRLSTLFCTDFSINSIAFYSTFLYLFQHGNLTEEFCMPMILAGLYFTLRFLLSEDERHVPGVAYVYGILLGLIAFIRLNNAIRLCALLLCIAVVLIRERQWMNLLRNIILGILGLASVTVPVCFYFYRHGALYDMLYGTFLLNLLYTRSVTHHPIFSSAFLYYMVLFVPGVYAAAVFWMKWKAERNRAYASLLFTTVLTYGMLVYTNSYLHYFMLGIPLFVVSVSTGSTLSGSGILSSIQVLCCRGQHTYARKESSLSVVLACIISVYALLSAYSACAPIYKTYLTNIAYGEYLEVQDGIAVIPENERDSIIAFNTVSNFYYHADILPCYRYFTLQKWLTTEKENIYQRFMLYLIEERPLWVVIRTGDNDKILNEILALLYSCKYSEGKYSYYRSAEPIIATQTSDYSAMVAQ